MSCINRVGAYLVLPMPGADVPRGPLRSLISRIIVPARKLIVDFIGNAVTLSSFADPFAFDARILEQPLHNVVD
ncbi:MAG: hypothetical protein HY865_05460 [Chloroflexi bacterium]|nr:hypothetical protein [Chloroflexota bacterium]